MAAPGTATGAPPRAPWLEDAAAVAAALGVDPARGLSAAEAAARLERHGPNQLEATRPVPAWRKFLAQFADPLIYLLLGAVAVSIVAWAVEGDGALPYDAIVIAAIVLLNGVLGYVQQTRAEEAVAALRRMGAPTATVVRDGETRRIPAAEVVPGDVIVVGEGDAVSADGRLVEAAALMVAEAALTGESAPVLKDLSPLAGEVALGDRANMVFAGTAVTRGRGRAVVTATAMETEMGRIAGMLARTEAEATPLQREVARVGRLLGIAVIAIAIVVVATILLTNGIGRASELVDVLLVGVSLAVAAVPEGLPAVLAVVLALGVQRMARRRAIVKRLASVETLGSASVVCSDKTGTLTENEMTITRVVTPSGTTEVEGSGYRPEGALRHAGKPLAGDPVLLEEVRAVLAGGSLANDAELRREEGEWVVRGDPTEGAFLVAEAKVPGLSEARAARFRRVGEIPFSPERKRMSTLEAETGDGGVVLVTKGAPDVLIARCVAERVAGEVRPLTDARRAAALAAVDGLAAAALRTLAVAYRPLAADEATEPTPELERELILLGVVGIIDPPRPEARAAVREAKSAGIRVLMITGDHPRTAGRIAADLEIAPPDARVLTGAELERLGEAALRETVCEVTVYARVAPEHKLRIVDALQERGEIVAMTGDGVNDAPALKSADIGVAMGITGTDVAKGAADMILADDNFATIVSAVREGRSIFANIRKFLRFLLSSNVGEVLVMFAGVLLAGVIGLDDAGEAVAVPLLATQILWINLLTDSAPALALGFDPPPADVMRRAPRRLGDRIIDGTMVAGIAWVGLVMAAVTLIALDLRLEGGVLGGSGDIDEARTMAFTTLVLAQLFNCFNARSDRRSAFGDLFSNRLLWGAVALSALLQVAVVELPFLNDGFGTVPLSLADWAICVGLASVVLFADELKKLAVRALGTERA